MPQFFVDRKISAGTQVEVRGADARHILNSLRLKPGDWIVLSDGQGRSFKCTIKDVRPAGVTLDVTGEIRRTQAGAPPALAIASIRGERMEWAIQKAVELGCRRIIPFNSARTVRRAEPASGSRKTIRLRKVAIEAAKQSGLPFVPRVDEPVDFPALCSMISGFEPALMLYEGESSLGLGKSLERMRPDREGIIVIGPEGGFTDDEVSSARESGAKTVSLGAQILKTETAAVAAIAIYQFRAGNMETG